MNRSILDTEAGVSMFKALSDESRIRIMLALRDRELCVCQMVNLLGLTPPTVSRHLQILREAGLINGVKKGRWVYYQFSSKPRHIEVHALLEPLLDVIA
ncbi:MAG: metalloregulator ArsR/SmtB family transcription factor, partial [candidate division Zixibacteria bacterium]|nr:metalloregulator ArsR/SmtB family transcription factor [candidate division Zixibacteria bacterium]